MVAVMVPAASSPALPINGGKLFRRSRPSPLSFNHRGRLGRREGEEVDRRQRKVDRRWFYREDKFCGGENTDLALFGFREIRPRPNIS
ncbi:hypothetical protein LINGRAHAP2_LOCUS26725 [Linum grandiflorum]